MAVPPVYEYVFAKFFYIIGSIRKKVNCQSVKFEIIG